LTHACCRNGGAIHSNPVLSALLRICAIRSYPVYISDVTRTESLNKRKILAREAIESLGSAVREMSKIFGLDELDYYIPSDINAMEAWDQELSATFTILETDGEDAKEALHREASRRPPARETNSGSATGGRDSAIWLSIKRMHIASTDQFTYFISSNTKDFATSRDDHQLRAELSSELGESVDRFIYVSSLERAVQLLAPSSEPQKISFSELQNLLQVTDLEQQLLETLQTSVRERELPQPLSLSVNEVRERRAYTVDIIRLAQIDIQFECSTLVSSENIVTPIKPVHGKASAWLYQGDENSSFEIDTMRFADTTFKLY
jgi:hypothetical protein